MDLVYSNFFDFLNSGITAEIVTCVRLRVAYMSTNTTDYAGEEVSNNELHSPFVLAFNHSVFIFSIIVSLIMIA